jgi:DNA-binding response OmpR family regulator
MVYKLHVKVLVVDDEKEIRFLLKRKLSFCGHEVVVAENGKEALDKIKESEFDLIILDLKMPVMDGSQFLTEYRSFNKNTPVIIISGHGDQEVVNKVIPLGIASWVVKPFMPEKILTLINNMFHKKAA